TTYGAGNVRSESMFDGDPTYVDVLHKLHEKQFPVVLGSPMQDGVVDSPYAAGVEAIAAGAISGGDTTGATLLVKMSRALYNSWWTEEKQEKRFREIPLILYPNLKEKDVIEQERMFGVDYKLFRREMYRPHVGELTVKMRDIKF
ncbi:MAG: hypothetical protein Q8R04_01795, partial [Nanoarchaeota archaeon]|nr:hypothetical protein [Nanoarchaeota archaeon]